MRVTCFIDKCNQNNSETNEQFSISRNSIFIKPADILSKNIELSLSSLKFFIYDLRMKIHYRTLPVILQTIERLFPQKKFAFEI